MNGGGGFGPFWSGGEVINGMDSYREKIAKMLESRGDTVRRNPNGTMTSSKLGVLERSIYDHNGFLNNEVNRENISILKEQGFKDDAADALVGWSMGADTAIQYLLETDKNDFEFIILDGARTKFLTPENIKIISEKTKALIITNHEADKMSGNLGLDFPIIGPLGDMIMGDRRVGQNGGLIPFPDIRSSAESASQAAIQNLPNTTQVVVPGDHDPAPEASVDALKEIY